METILQITKMTSTSNPNSSVQIWDGLDGYAVRTNKQEILLQIDDENSASCCEKFGYFMSNDDIEEFIGAELLTITITDTNLKTKTWEKESPGYLDEGQIMFVNLETDRGILQFVAYNSHNGYYGHTAKVVSNQLIHEAHL